MVAWIICQPISPPLHVYKLRSRASQSRTRHFTIHSITHFVSCSQLLTASNFLLQLSKKETLLERSFFKTPEGDDDDELKISFVWSRLPEVYQKEMRRNSLETIQNWEDFERALRNAETVVKIDSDVAPAAPREASGDGRNRGKRHASQANNWYPGKKQDRKHSLFTPLRDQFPAHNAPPASSSNAEQRGNRPWLSNQGGGGNHNQGYQRNQKPHWKNKGDQQNQLPADNTGKGKP
jgi:hypothetical protein